MGVGAERSAADACANGKKLGAMGLGANVILPGLKLILDVIRASNDSTAQDARLCDDDPDLCWWVPLLPLHRPSGVSLVDRWPLALHQTSCSGGARQGAALDELAGEEWAVSY